MDPNAAEPCKRQEGENPRAGGITAVALVG
jgi:hypothetical protein